MMAKSSPVRPRHSIRLTLAVSKKVPIGRAPAASFCLSVFSMRIPPYLVSMARLYLHFGTKASIDARTFASAESIAGQNENGGRSAFAVHVILVVIRHTFHVLCCQSYIAICRDPTVEFRFFLPAALRLQ